MQINKNPEFFSPFFAFFRAQQLTTPHGNEIFWPAGVSTSCREELYHLPGKQQTGGKSRFFVDDLLIVLGFRAWIEMCLRFWEIFRLLARNFESTKTPRESLLDAYDCGLSHQMPSHTGLSHQTPSHTCSWFGGCSCSWGAIDVRKWSVSVQLGGVFCLIPCTPNFNQFRPLKHLKVEVQASVENL